MRHEGNNTRDLLRSKTAARSTCRLFNGIGLRRAKSALELEHEGWHQAVVVLSPPSSRPDGLRNRNSYTTRELAIEARRRIATCEVSRSTGFAFYCRRYLPGNSFSFKCSRKRSST